MSQAVTPVIGVQDAGMATPERGLRRQVMAFTDNLMLVRHRMDKGWVGAKHRHPHEQMVYILSGKIRFETTDGTFVVGPGDSFIVRGNIDHQASALEDSEVLDIFTPCREDYAPQS